MQSTSYSETLAIAKWQCGTDKKRNRCAPPQADEDRGRPQLSSAEYGLVPVAACEDALFAQSGAYEDVLFMQAADRWPDLRSCMQTPKNNAASREGGRIWDAYILCTRRDPHRRPARTG